MRESGPIELRVCSGPPWHLEYGVESIGDDYVCRIHGGERHIGAVALSEWRADRATTECLTVSGHKERGIAMHAAHTLCAAGRRSVSCIAGIHFDSLKPNEVESIVETVYALTREAAAALEQRRLSDAIEDSRCLLPRIEGLRGELAREVRELMTVPPRAAPAIVDGFDGRVILFAPLYLCSACSNDCAYCGFRKSASFDRTRLSIEQAVQEARQLARQGHRTIDLVTGEVATDRFVDYVCEATREILADGGIRRVNLNMGALTTEQFRRLKAAGAASYHLYQETYAPQTYFEVHRRGLKRDMAYRLAGAHRAAEAGFESIGLGILLGLHPIEDDLAALAAHARILTEDFPRVRIGFSLPRLQDVDAGCEYSVAAPVGDAEFIQAALFLRRRFPSAHLTVTTRERPEIRDRLVALGATKLSAGVSTAPGGYTLEPSGTPQFEISDRRPLPEIADLVRRSGRTPVYE